MEEDHPLVGVGRRDDAAEALGVGRIEVLQPGVEGLGLVVVPPQPQLCGEGIAGLLGQFDGSSSRTSSSTELTVRAWSWISSSRSTLRMASSFWRR